MSKVKTKHLWFVATGVVLVLLIILGSGEGMRDEMERGIREGEEMEKLSGEQEDTDEFGEQEDMLEVLHVFDGDTFSVKIDDKVEMVRVIGIDSPETGEKYRDKECYGKEATERAVELLGGGKVRLEADPTQADRDKYDRLLRYVYLADGTFFNLVMIEEGFAEEYTFEGLAYEHQKDFLEVENFAKDNGEGLWGECKD